MSSSRQLDISRFLRSSRRVGKTRFGLRTIYSDPTRLHPGTVSTLFAQVTSNVNQSQNTLPVLFYTQQVADSLANQFKSAWEAGKVTFDALLLRGDLQLGVTERCLLQAEQVLFRERLLEIILEKSEKLSWKNGKKMDFYPVGRKDLLKLWKPLQGSCGVKDTTDFRKRLTQIYLKNALLETPNVDGFNCDLTCRIGWHIDPNSNEPMFFPISVFDPDLHFTTRVQTLVRDIRRLRFSLEIPDIHKCSAYLEELKDLLFTEEIYRILWPSKDHGVHINEIQNNNTKFTVTPIDLNNRLERMKQGQFALFYYDKATQHFHINEYRNSFKKQIESVVNQRHKTLEKIERIKKGYVQVNLPTINIEYDKLLHNCLPTAFSNPLLYDESVLTRIFKSWTVNGTPTIESFQYLINLRCQEEHGHDASLMKKRFPIACKYWRDYLKAHPNDNTLDYEPLIRIAHHLKEGGFVMNLLQDRLSRGTVSDSLCIYVLEAITQSNKYSRTRKWINAEKVHQLCNAILAQPNVSIDLYREVQTTANRFNVEVQYEKCDSVPQVGLQIFRHWKSKRPDAIIPLLKNQNWDELTHDQIYYLLSPMFQANNGQVEHFATVPAIIEALRSLKKRRDIRSTLFTSQLVGIFENLAHTEKSDRSIKLILKTMEDLQLPICQKIFNAALREEIRHSGHINSLSLDEIISKAKLCGENILTFDRLLELILYNTISESCANPMKTTFQKYDFTNDRDSGAFLRPYHHNTRLVKNIWYRIRELNIKPNITTFNLTADYFSKIGDKEGVLEIIDSMHDEITPNEHTLMILSDLYLEPQKILEYIGVQQPEKVRQLLDSISSCYKEFHGGEARGALLKKFIQNQRGNWICFKADGQFYFFPRTSELMTLALSKLETQLIVLDEEPRNKIQTVLDNYIQANLPHFKHAFQIKPQIFREHVMTVINEAKAKIQSDTEEMNKTGFYINIYENVREYMGSFGRKITVDEIQQLVHAPAYSFATGQDSGLDFFQNANVARRCFSTKAYSDDFHISNSSTVQALQKFHDHDKYQHKSSVKIILEDFADEENTIDTYPVYKPTLPPQLEASTKMFAQKTLHTSLVLNASENLSRSPEYCKTVLFSIPTNTFERERNISNLIQQALNTYSVVQICQIFLSDITHTLAIEALMKLKEEVSIKPYANDSRKLLETEFKHILSTLFQISASVHYSEEENLRHEYLVVLHEVFHELKLEDRVLWLEHEKIILEDLSNFNTEQLCRLLILRLQYKKTNDDIIHGLFNNLVKKDFTSLTTYFYHTLFELLDSEMIHLNNHNASDLYLKLQDSYSNHLERQDLLEAKDGRYDESKLVKMLEWAEREAVSFVSTGQIDCNLFISEILDRMSNRTLGHLLVGFTRHHRKETSIIEQTQQTIIQRLIDSPSSLDGSELDALVACLQHFDMDMTALHEVEELFGVQEMEA